MGMKSRGVYETPGGAILYKAIAGFDPARGGSFLAYFDRIYGNAMHPSVNREDAIYHQERQSLSRREIRMLKEMQQLARSMGYDLSLIHI